MSPGTADVRPDTGETARGLNASERAEAMTTSSRAGPGGVCAAATPWGPYSRVPFKMSLSVAFRLIRPLSTTALQPVFKPVRVTLKNGLPGYIRLATADDFDALCNFYKDAPDTSVFTRMALSCMKATEVWEMQALDDLRDTTLVLEDPARDKIIGICSFRIACTSDDALLYQATLRIGIERVVISGLSVLKDYHGLGVATHLKIRQLMLAAQQGFKGIAGQVYPDSAMKTVLERAARALGLRVDWTSQYGRPWAIISWP